MDAISTVNTFDILTKLGNSNDAASVESLFGAMTKLSAALTATTNTLTAAVNNASTNTNAALGTTSSYLDTSNYTPLMGGNLTYPTPNINTWYTVYNLTGKKGFIARCMANRMLPSTPGTPSAGKVRITIDGVASEFCCYNSISNYSQGTGFFGGLVNPCEVMIGDGEGSCRIGEFAGYYPSTGGVNALPYTTAKTPSYNTVDVFSIPTPLWFNNSLKVEVFSADLNTSGFIVSIKGGSR